MATVMGVQKLDGIVHWLPDLAAEIPFVSRCFVEVDYSSSIYDVADELYHEVLPDQHHLLFGLSVREFDLDFGVRHPASLVIVYQGTHRNLLTEQLLYHRASFPKGQMCPLLKFLFLANRLLLLQC